MADATLARLGAVAGQQWGLFTTAQAEEAGVPRKQLSRMAATGVLERIAHRVYRMSGAPELQHEHTYATWLALGGADYPSGELPSVVAAGTTATTLHGIGDFFQEGYDFIVPARKGTRLPGVRFRIRKLARDEITFVDQMPVLTIERTIADLMEQGTDFSLVADAVRDAIDQHKLVEPRQLVTYLDPLAKARGRTSGLEVANDLFELAGAEPVDAPR